MNTEKQKSRGFRGMCLVLALVLVAGLALAGTAAAQGQAAMVREGGKNVLVLPNGKAFHSTANEVLGLRTLDVDPSTQIYLWDEELPGGGTRSHYAVGTGTELRGRARATTYDVRFRDHQFDPLVSGPPGVSVALAARADNNLHLVQFVSTPLPQFREEITALGGKVLRFLADHTFVVEMEPQTRAQVGRLGYVRWIGPYHPTFRTDRAIRDAIDGNAPERPTQRYSIMVGERGAARQAEVAALVEQLGGVVDLVEPAGLRVEATLSQDQLREVLHSNAVQFVDAWGGPGETDMNIVRTVGGGNYVESVAGYTGQGVRGEIFDTELRTTHQEWNHTPIIHSASTSCSSLHGTSCYSNNFAQGVDPTARGMIPDGQGIFFCYSESTQFGGSKSRLDMNAELVDPAGPYRAVFQTSSVGSARTFFYTTLSADTDDYLFQVQLLSTQSQSNAGNQDSRPQAWAKNIVSVGGIRHLNTLTRCDDYHGSSGSTGPAEDGRIKPDLSYFYDSIQSASGGGDASYTGFGGTSSATPQTSGHFGLLFQMWHDGVWAGHGGGVDVFDSRPKMMTAKALMVNTAYRYDWTNPGGCSYGDANRWRQGWGTANVQNLYDRAPLTTVIDETDVIAPLETKSYSVTVAAGQGELNVTLAYADPAGTVGAQYNRVNDLSLRVTSPSATVYWGNNGLTADNWSTSGGVSNVVDTVENVFLQNPEPGTWTIDVIADEIVEDGHVETGALDADFALVIYGGTTGSATCTTNADCDDADVCNGVETCVDSACQSGTPLVCDDGAFCNGAETCDAALGCQAGTPPSCTFGCDEGADACFECGVDADCDDALFCTGTETCGSGYCSSSGDPCLPGETCDEGLNQCVSCAPLGASCVVDSDCCGNKCRGKSGAKTCK